MSTLATTPDQDAIFGEIFIAAPPERVYQAITDPLQLLQWWGQGGMYRCVNWEADLRVGGRWKSEGMSESSGKFQVEGEYLEIDPPRLLVYSWRSSWRDFKESKVRWDLTPSAGGTLLKIRHSGLAQDPEAAKNYGGGWPRVLAWMQAFVERGETVETRPAIGSR
jgi:uncharacterized protein YndB with AHSA1/START domain